MSNFREKNGYETEKVTYETRLQIYFLIRDFISIKEIVCWNFRGGEFLIAITFEKRNLLRLIIILWYLHEEKKKNGQWKKFENSGWNLGKVLVMFVIEKCKINLLL